MTSFFDAVSAVSLLLMLMGTGYFMGHRGWMGKGEKAFLGKFILYIAVPANCVTGILNHINMDLLHSVGPMVGVAFISVGGTLLLSVITARCLKIPKNQSGIFSAMAGLSNVIFIGLPVTTQIFGEAGVPYLMVYYLANTTFLQTAGMLLVQQSGQGQRVKKQPITIFLKNFLLKPPIIAIVASIFMMVMSIRPYPIFMRYAEYISGTVSPLALIYCGFILYEVGIKNMRPMRGHMTALVLRLVIAPVICWGIAVTMGMSGLALGVFVLVSGLPSPSQIPVFAGTFGADEKYAATGACLSVFGCCITVPIIMMFIG